MKFLKLRFAYLLLLLGGVLVFINFYQLQQTHDLKKITLSKDPILQNEIEIKKLSNLKIIPEAKVQETYVLNFNSCVLNEHLNNCVPIVKEIKTSSKEDCLVLADDYTKEFVDLIDKGIDIKISCIKTSRDIAFDSSLALQENLL
jgi:hypothetical protein